MVGLSTVHPAFSAVWGFDYTQQFERFGFEINCELSERASHLGVVYRLLEKIIFDVVRVLCYFYCHCYSSLNVIVLLFI